MDNLNLTKTDETRKGCLKRFHFCHKMIHILSGRNITEETKFEFGGTPEIFQIQIEFYEKCIIKRALI